MIVKNDDNQPEFDPTERGDWATYRRLVLSELESIKKRLDEFEKTFVKQVEFFPVKAFVYAMISLVMTAVLGAILLLVINR